MVPGQPRICHLRSLQGLYGADNPSFQGIGHLTAVGFAYQCTSKPHGVYVTSVVCSDCISYLLSLN